MMLSADDQRRIGAAIHAAEAATSGEIVCVLAHAASDYAEIPLLWSLFLALALPWPLIVFTPWSVQHIYLVQLAVFLLAGLALTQRRLRLWLVPRSIQRARAHAAALEQFELRHVSHTAARTGILIFVSLAERYVRIIADTGIAAKIPQDEWQGIVDALIGEAKAGRVVDGFIGAVGACGARLAAHFPAEADHANQLPDRIYFI
ncbi:MAG: TPM domain-containing protein [Hyphomicrobiales bacterium]|nr:TPM domain-containing protein [Hyphomicrobiales bacterium]